MNTSDNSEKIKMADNKEFSKGFYWDGNSLVYFKGGGLRSSDTINLTNVFSNGIYGPYVAGIKDLTLFNPEKDFDKLDGKIAKIVKDELEKLAKSKA